MEKAIGGPGVRVCVYFGERDRLGGKPLWSALIAYLRGEGAAGVTVMRAVAGYGAHSKLHSASLIDLSTDLPFVLEWVDTQDMVDRLLPEIEARLDGGMITYESVTIYRYKPHSS